MPLNERLPTPPAKRKMNNYVKASTASATSKQKTNKVTKKLSNHKDKSSKGTQKTLLMTRKKRSKKRRSTAHV